MLGSWSSSNLYSRSLLTVVGLKDELLYFNRKEHTIGHVNVNMMRSSDSVVLHVNEDETGNCYMK